NEGSLAVAALAVQEEHALLVGPVCERIPYAPLEKGPHFRVRHHFSEERLPQWTRRCGVVGRPADLGEAVREAVLMHVASVQVERSCGRVEPGRVLVELVDG